MAKRVLCVGKIEEGKIKMKRKCPTFDCKNIVWGDDLCIPCQKDEAEKFAEEQKRPIFGLIANPIERG